VGIKLTSAGFLPCAKGLQWVSELPAAARALGLRREVRTESNAHCSATPVVEFSVKKDEDPSRSPLAVGIMWASRVTTLAMEFALPALLGVYVDGRWGTKPVITLLGFVLGFGAGMMHILRISREGTGS
jgi:ATP synthase protein I